MGDLIDRQAAIDAVRRSEALDRAFGYGHAVDALRELPSAQPEHTNSCYTNSWCIDCKEYDPKNKCCPRYSRVIKQTLDDAYRHGETEAEARFHAQQRWIPCSERLPSNEDYDETFTVTIQCEHVDGWDDYVTGYADWTPHGWDIQSYYLGQIKVTAWMPLPEPYAERRTDGV